MRNKENLTAENAFMADEERASLEELEANGVPFEQAFAALALEIVPTIREQLHKCFSAHNLTITSENDIMARLAVSCFLTSYLPSKDQKGNPIIPSVVIRDRLGTMSTMTMAALASGLFDSGQVQMHQYQPRPKK